MFPFTVLSTLWWVTGYDVNFVVGRITDQEVLEEHPDAALGDTLFYECCDANQAHLVRYLASQTEADTSRLCSTSYAGGQGETGAQIWLLMAQTYITGWQAGTRL